MGPARGRGGNNLFVIWAICSPFIETNCHTGNYIFLTFCKLQTKKTEGERKKNAVKKCVLGDMSPKL